MAKYNSKYRIESTRATWWDYAFTGSYFVTFITKNRVPFFGHIRNGVMCLNEVGTLLHYEWAKTPTVRPDMNIALGAFVVMPDHFHGIIRIGDNEYNQGKWGYCGDQADNNGKDKDIVNGEIKTIPFTPCLNQFGPQRKNVASIIRGVKSTVTVQARKINPRFGWQPRFHDRIIRDEVAYSRITRYIIRNPAQWKKKRR